MKAAARIRIKFVAFR